MTINKILYIVKNKEIISKLKKVGVENFLFPLKGFCVGFLNDYELSEIEDNSFILINRILDNKSLDKLEELLKNNKKKIKGIVYDDFGVLYIINKLKLDVKTINYQNHFGTNYKSINENLKYNDSVVVSSDITYDEIKEITNNTSKPVCIFLMGYLQAMYSRRMLLKNYYDEFDLTHENSKEIYESISDNKFIMVENEYGTVGYQKNFYNGIELLDLDNILYYLINPVFLTDDEEIKLIEDLKNNEFNLEIDSDTGFLHKSTIYKLKEVPKNEK